MAFLSKRLSFLAAVLRGERFDAKEINPLALRFRDPLTESAFAEVHFREHALSTLIYTFLGLGVYLTFGVLDFFYLDEGAGTVFMIRLAVSLAMFIFISAWFLLGSRIGYHLMPAIAMAVAGAGIIVMTMVMPAPKNETYYAGILLVVAYFCNMPLLRFYQATAVTAFLVGLYTLSALVINPIPTSIWINNIFFFVSMALWCLWTNYWQQLYARQDFSHTRKLRAESAKNSALFHEAEAANRAKSDFLAVMSHELRTPLNAILGFSDIMKQQIHGPLGNESYEEYLEHIHGSGTHLLRLINDILDLSKADAGKLDISAAAIDPVTLSQAIREMLIPLADKNNVNLAAIPPKFQPGLNVDERLVRQVLLNLLSNAIKFTPEGGTVSVSFAMLDDGGYAIQVKDTGIGIAEDDLPRILEPFVQVESSISRKFDGTGLGLPLARKMMQAHGGDLVLESEVGKGTTAIALFPAERVMPEGANPPLAAAGE